MSEIWGWSTSDEYCDGEDEAGSTREEAIAEALETKDFGPGDGFFTFRKEPVDFDKFLTIDADQILDWLADEIFETCGEDASDRVGNIDGAPREALGAMLTEALRKWWAEQGATEAGVSNGWFTLEDSEYYKVPAA